jgi:hypothetical protein
VSFLQAELPDVIYQLLLWHGVKSLIYAASAVVIFLMFFRQSVYFAKAILRECENDGDGSILFIPYAFAHILYLFPISLFNLTWLQIWIAPKVWLLEYAANLVK